mgnify:CR=1 FL=1|jgi:hypothetical protein
MDPESCLQMIIDLLEDASNPDFWNDEALSVEDEVGYLARCLRDWLTRGGFAPEVAPDRLAWLAARSAIHGATLGDSPDLLEVCAALSAL